MVAFNIKLVGEVEKYPQEYNYKNSAVEIPLNIRMCPVFPFSLHLHPFIPIVHNNMFIT